MAEIFERCFRGATEGHAVYPKVSGDQMKPGACGYFNRHHDWVTVVQTLDKDELVKHDLTTLDDAILIDCGEDDQWDIRRSGNITIKKIQLDANASAPGAPGGGAALKFTSNRGEGAIMVPGSTITERRAEPASAFRKWMAKNAQNVIAIPICDEEVVRDKGLWIITKTFTAKRRAIAVLETAGSEISIGVDVTIPTVVQARSAVGFWKSAEHSTGWIVQRNEKDGVVLFASGIYYKPRLLSRELKAVEDKERQMWLEAGVKRSPIDVGLAQSSLPGAEYIRLWPCAFGKPDGLGELPTYEESGDEKATEDEESGDEKVAEHEDLGSDLMREIQGFPQPLQETLAPLLAEKTMRKRIKDNFDDLGQDKKRLGESTLKFLNMLGSLDESEDESEGDSEDDDSGKNDDSGGNGQAEDSPDKQVLSQDTNFFSWADFERETLAPKYDVVAARHKAILAIYDGVGIEVKALGSGVSLQGVAKLIRDSLHQEDPLTFFRGTERTILFPKPREDVSQPDLDELEKQLFDSNKYLGYDERLTVLTYNKGGNGSISLFKLWRDPDRIRPVAAMEPVPKFVLRSFCSYTNRGSKTKLCMRNSGMLWKRGYLSRNDGPFLRPAPDQSQSGSTGCPGIGDTLKRVLGQDPRCARWESFVATIPEMIAVLHLGTSLLKDINSTPVYPDQDTSTMKERCVTMLHGPSASGHLGHNAQIVVLSTRTGKWAKEKLSWK